MLSTYGSTFTYLAVKRMVYMLPCLVLLHPRMFTLRGSLRATFAWLLFLLTSGSLSYLSPIGLAESVDKKYTGYLITLSSSALENCMQTLHNINLYI